MKGMRKDSDTESKPTTVLEFPLPKLLPIAKRLDRLRGVFTASLKRLKEAGTYEQKQKLIEELQQVVDECRLLMMEQHVEASIKSATASAEKSSNTDDYGNSVQAKGYVSIREPNQT